MTANENSAQEKARIDRGAHGDKVPGFDPAAAPLGTDEEASGFSPITSSIVDRTRTAPDLPAGQTTPADSSIAPDADPAKPRQPRWLPLLLAPLGLAFVLVVWLAWRGL